MKAWSTMICASVMAAMIVSPALADTANANARGDLRTASPVTAVGISGDAQKLVVGMEDLGSYPTDPAETTWSVYDILEQHYSELQRGSADEDAGCREEFPVALPPPEDDCQTPIVDVAVSKTGDRILIAASGSQNWVILASAWTGKIAAITLQGDVVDIDLSTDSRSGLALTNDRGTARAFLLAITATTLTATEVTLASVSNDVPISVDLVDSGPYALVITQKRVELLRNDTSIYSNRMASVIGGSIASVEPHRFIATSTGGLLRLYHVAQEDASFMLLNVPSSAKETSAIAISPDGELLYIGRTDGTLELHQIHEDPVQLKLLSVLNLGAPADQILLTPDGESMFIVAGNSIGQYLPDLGLYQVWSGTMDNNITSVAFDDAGKRVVVAASQTVRIFEGVSDLRIDVPEQVEVLPGQRNAVAIDLVNRGNRVEHVSWQLQMEKDWMVTGKKGEVYILPGESHTIFAYTDVPYATPPQVAPLKISAASKTHIIELVVPEVRAFDWISGTDNVELKAKPGSTVTWRGELGNIGNIPAKPQLRLESLSAGWTGTVLKSPGMLQPLEANQVELSLTAPSSARHLEAGAFEVLVGDNVLKLTGIVGATFGVEIEAPQVINGEHEEVTMVKFQVHNTGNVPEDLIIGVEDVPVGWTAEFGGRPDLQVKALGPGKFHRAVMLVSAPEEASGNGFVTLVAKSAIHASVSDAKMMTIVIGPDSDSERAIPVPFHTLMLAIGLALTVRMGSRQKD